MPFYEKQVNAKSDRLLDIVRNALFPSGPLDITGLLISFPAL